MAERPRVLVVDDEPDIGRLLRLVLELEGFEPFVVEGGAAAMLALRAGPLPACIVLDIQMPVMDGWQTLEAVRSDPRSAVVPVVLCSVKSHDVDLGRGWSLGCDAYVTKPFASDELVREIREVIGRTDAERAARRASALRSIQRPAV